MLIIVGRGLIEYSLREKSKENLIKIWGENKIGRSRVFREYIYEFSGSKREVLVDKKAYNTLIMVKYYVKMRIFASYE